VGDVEMRRREAGLHPSDRGGRQISLPTTRCCGNWRNVSIRFLRISGFLFDRTR
jgi:hypothetical protein